MFSVQIKFRSVPLEWKDYLMQSLKLHRLYRRKAQWLGFWILIQETAVHVMFSLGKTHHWTVRLEWLLRKQTETSVCVCVYISWFTHCFLLPLSCTSDSLTSSPSSCDDPHNKSAETEACGVEEGGENRMIARSLFHLSLIQCLFPWVSHNTFFFIFTSVCILFFLHPFFPPHIIFPYLSVLVPVPYSPCCCQFPDGRTWVVSPFQQRRKSQSSWPVSEKWVRRYWSLSKYECRWVLSTLPFIKTWLQCLEETRFLAALCDLFM